MFLCATLFQVRLTVSSPVIEFRDFSFKYRVQAEPTLLNINLKINAGEKILVCGSSGCGKSTLASTLNGLIPASYKGDITGDLIIDGKSWKDWDLFSLSKVTGTVLQDSDGQFIGLTVGEDIAFALENDCVPSGEMKKEVREAAERVGMEDFLLHSPQSLSGGQKQRVSLAGVMVDRVKIFLFDEPLANLDPESGKKTIELIDELRKSTGATVIIIEHRLEDVLWRSVDRIVLMKDGRITSDSTPDELLASSLLSDTGIREPLYVTALKYAGVKITEEMHPGRIDTLVLTEDDREKIRKWFKSVPEEKERKKGETLLDVKGLSFTYPGGHRALEDIDFTLERGEMVSIVGRNGAGKSTFSKIICGFEKEDKGTLTLSGKNLPDLSVRERACHIGYVMQNPNQMITQTMIKDEVTLGLRMEKKKSEEEIERTGDEILTVCGLKPFRSWPISALSYGQKKRVTIASILSLHPEIIILDEPTAGQDFRHYTEIMEFLKDLNRKGVTIILITHDMHLMLEYCTRSVVFTDGRKIADSTPWDILSNETLTQEASLKKTSLSTLALECGLDEREFIRRFIEYDRSVRA